MGPPAQTPSKQRQQQQYHQQSTTTTITSSSSSLVTPLKTPMRTPGGEQTSSTPIISFEAIESQKENVQPLARGRSAHALSNTLSLQHKQRQAALSAQRKAHEQEVTSEQNADSDDPLEAWNRYVKWCIDNFPSGQNHESGLVPLLERATRTFRHSDQYTNDSRYLRLWILYARNVECARDVYNFLLANEIGTKLASLYEELAVVLEGQGIFDEANSTYRLGIARRANPIDRLKRRYAEFQQRIMMHPQASTSRSGPQQQPLSYNEALAAAMASSGRSMLGNKVSTSGPQRSLPTNAIRGTGRSMQPLGSSLGAPSPGPNNGSKISVFRDNEDDEPRPSSNSHGWEDLGTVESRRQENKQGDRADRGMQLGASGGVKKKVGGGLAVFKDSDEEDEEDGQHQSKGAAGALGPKDIFSSHSKKPPTETDLLRKNPFMHWDSDTKKTPEAADIKPPPPSTRSSGGSSGSRSGKASSSRDGHKSSSGEKARKTSSTSKSGGSSKQASSTGTGVKEERHAIPLKLLYPGLDIEQAVQSRAEESKDTVERCIEEILVERRGWAFDGTADDPWEHLDYVVGKWIPSNQDEEDEEEPEHPDSDPGLAEKEPVTRDSEPQQGTPRQSSPSAAPPAPEPEQGSERTDPVPQADAPTLHSGSKATQEIGVASVPCRDVFDPDNSIANAEALNLRPRKRSENSGKRDRSEKRMMSPTLVTKATMREVENMFNGDESDESDSDDDYDTSSEDEEDDDLQPLRKPDLKRVVGSQVPPASMMSAPAGDVPPTPTPLSRNQSAPNRQAQNDENALSRALNDENANVKATPMRTPLGTKVPFGTSTPMRAPLSSRPAPVAARPVFRDEDEDEDGDEVRNEPLPPPARALAQRTFKPSLEEAEEEEEEEEDEDSEPEGEDERYAEYEEGEEREEAQPGDMDYRKKPFQPLTPITEATYEFTRYTSARTPATATRNSSNMKSWRSARGSLAADYTGFTEISEGQELVPGPLNLQEEEDGNAQEAGEEGFLESRDDDVQEVEQQVERLALNREDDRSFASSNGTSAGTIDDRSNWGGKTPFDLTEGLTISRAEGECTGKFAHEQFSKSFTIDDRENAAELETSARAAADEGEESAGERDEGDREREEAVEEVGERTIDNSSHHPGQIQPQSQEEVLESTIAQPPSSTFMPPNPCSPVDPEVVEAILGGLQLSIESSSNFVDLQTKSAQGKLASLQKRAKANMRKSIGNTSMIKGDWILDIEGNRFEVREKLGEGGYGAVFLAEDVNNCSPPVRKPLGGVNGDSSFEAGLAELSIEEEDEEEAERRRLVAIKVESPPNRWEFYILGQLRARMPAKLLRSIVSARRFFAYEDESLLLLEYGEKGTLLEVVNNATVAGVASSTGSTVVAGAAGSVSSSSGVDEVLAMFFTIELLKLVEGLHDANLIHGDLKIDNCLLRLEEPGIGETWSNAYQSDGSLGWSSKGLTLIDFGRAIDLSRFPKGQTFIADWSPDPRDCPEMRQAQPWTFETDYFGVASVAYCLLFGKYIETTTTTTNDKTRCRINQTLKRYWQVEIWNTFFETLLNPKSFDPSLPITEEIRSIREQMQVWLQANCNRAGKNLKGMIRKLEIWAMKK
ncbi:hypothetical protein IE53DRAFT_339471 [Violaceomyces palustris]|uniref:Uncharacterized protein n=1 Tax=Violaceomyces palustris TaxID=1673888 RepID=A0ACD0P4W7_9BASI|nr:hypothetical protein IE53DRAFT_339471 [Violaceomyces palustris]